MTSLIVPDIRLHNSWLAGAEEFQGAHLDGAGVEGVGAEQWPLDELRDPKTFRRFTAALIADALPDARRKEGYVPCTYRWIVDADTFLGSIAVRHELNEYLLQEGGHIGYSVRPSERRRGHANNALREILPVAWTLGIDQVLLTCDESNAGSRATIERNDGVYEDSRNGKRRYWISPA